MKFHRRNISFDHEQRAHLGIPVLLNHKDQVMGVGKIADIIIEGKGFEAQLVNFYVIGFQKIQRSKPTRMSLALKV